MYNKVATDMNFVAREKEVTRMWKEKDIIRKSFHLRDGNPQFTFFDGPPTANGKPHIGHIETRGRSRSILAWTANPRSNSTGSNPSSRNARRAYGNTCMNGRR